jgi:hypothetical protein
LGADAPGGASVTLRLIVPHPSGQRVLLDTGAGEPGLPAITIPKPPGDSWWRETALINRAVRERLGLKSVVLYRADMDGYNAAEDTSGVFVLEMLDAQWAPGGTLAWSAFDQNPSIARALQSQQGDKLPWTRPGWFREASEWISAFVPTRGWTVTSEVEQVRSWFLSSILHAQTTGGGVYLKAVPAAYGYEPVLTWELSQRYPGLLPEVLSIYDTQRWLLMQAVEGIRLDRHPDRTQYLPRWEELLGRYARMQLDYRERSSDLLAMGLPDWRLESISAQIEPFFILLPYLYEESDAALGGGVMARLEAAVPRLLQVCARLGNYGLPPTLHHGDVHSGNILANEAECKLLDWAGFVAVAHPFAFLSTVFDEHRDPAAQARLLDSYLASWQEYGPPERLREAARLAVPVGWFSGALGHAAQLASATAPWEMAQEWGNLVYSLKGMADALEKLEG